ncbi:hypothetical protein Tco_0077608 [Tanacetum coccineum]
MSQLLPRIYRNKGRIQLMVDPTVSKVPNTEDMIKFMLDTKEFTYTMDMFRVTLHLLVKTPKNPFVAPVNIQTIEAFMYRVGYQGVVDKVIAFYTKNLAQPWHIMSKKKEAIQYPRFIKLIIADLMKKFPNIPQRIDEDYHSIKDDIPLVSVYTTGNVLVRGMLISDAFLTEEIRATDDFKEYETGKKRKQTAGDSSSPRKSLRITITQKLVVEGDKDDDDSEDRLEPESRKENPEYVDDDDDAEEKDGRQGYMIQNTGRKCVTTNYFWKTHTTVDRVLHEIVRQLAEKTTDDLIENNLKPSIVAAIIEDRDAFRSELPDLVHPTTTTSTKTTSSADLQQQLYLKMKRRTIILTHKDMMTIKRMMLLLRGEKSKKTYGIKKTLKFARGSSSKHSAKDFITYVSKQQQQQHEWDAWVEETVIDDDEVIPEDETLELITEL